MLATARLKPYGDCCSQGAFGLHRPQGEGDRLSLVSRLDQDAELLRLLAIGAGRELHAIAPGILDGRYEDLCGCAGGRVSCIRGLGGALDPILGTACVISTDKEGSCGGFGAINAI